MDSQIVDLDGIRSDLRRRFAQLGRRIRWRLVLEGTSWIAGQALGLALLGGLLDWDLHLTLGMRLALLCGATVWIGWEAVRRI